MRRPFQHARPFALRHAAGHGYRPAGARTLPSPQLAEQAVDLVLGLLPHRARVEYEQIGIVPGTGAFPSPALEQLRNKLGVGLVHLTAVGDDGVLHRRENTPDPSGANP